MRVLSANLQHGLTPRRRPTDAAALGAAFDGVEADLVCLQEVDRGQRRSGRVDQARVIGEAMGLPHVRTAAALAGDLRVNWRRPHSSGTVAGPTYGLAIASRWPVLAWFVRPLPVLAMKLPMRRANGWHLMGDEPRVALGAVVDTPDGALGLVTTHLSLVVPWAVRQLDRVLTSADTLPRRTIVCGDLNLGPIPVRRLAHRWDHVDALTFPAAAPRRQIDHMLSRGLPPGRATALRLPISDHRALLVDYP